MPLYLCRWPNSDVSVVLARNKNEAIIRLDEFENPEGAQITRLTDFLADFQLNDEGRFGVWNVWRSHRGRDHGKAFPQLGSVWSMLAPCFQPAPKPVRIQVMALTATQGVANPIRPVTNRARCRHQA